MQQYIDKLQPPLQELVQALRSIILPAAPEIAEHIKWNSPAFYYSGPMHDFDPKTYQRDIAVMNLRQKEGILLILPHGAELPDPSGIKESTYTDGRAMLRFKNREEIALRAYALRQMLNAAVTAIQEKLQAG